MFWYLAGQYHGACRSIHFHPISLQGRVCSFLQIDPVWVAGLRFSHTPLHPSPLHLQVMSILQAHPLPPPYYPGIQGRYAAWKEQYPDAQPVGGQPYTPSRPMDGPSLPFLVRDMGVLEENDPRVAPGKEYAFSVRLLSFETACSWLLKGSQG